MQKPKRLNQKQVKIMSNNTKDKGGKRDWSMALGLYPGILFGMRSYHGPTHSQHVFYLPVVDLAIEIENEPI